MKVKIAAAQIEIKPWDLKANFDKISGVFEVAGKQKCNFLCLPEACWVGPDYKEKERNEVAIFVKNHLPALTSKYNLYCIAGTVDEYHKGVGGTLRHHVHSYLFGPDGKIVGKYSKRHLVPSLEEPTLDPGKVHRVFDTEFGKIGIQICRDILYPEVTHVLADMGAKIIFSPAFWWKTTNLFDEEIRRYHTFDELQAIKSLVPARAIENDVVFIFTNAAGHYSSTNQRFSLLGYTQICEPYVGVKKILKHNTEEIVISTVNTDIVDSARAGWKIRGH